MLCGVSVVCPRFGRSSRHPSPLPRTPLPRTPHPPDRPKFRSFFPRPPQFSFFLPSLRVFSWNFGGVFESWDPEMCTFGLSRRAHFRALALQTPPKFHERTSKRERRKKENFGGRGKKKSEILGTPPFGAPPSADTLA